MKKKDDLAELTSCIIAKMCERGYRRRDLATRSLMTYSTLCYRFKHPDTFNLGEIKRIESALDFCFIKTIKVIGID